MKNILRGAVAAVALVSMGGVAQAQTAEVHYAGGPVSPLTNPTGLALIGAGLNELALLGGIGTRYTAFADAPSDTTPATPVVTVAFKLTGKVNKDCSFYAGNSPSNNIDFGVIGVRTGNNENVNQAFEMVGKAEAEIKTLTAGCNFNNTVELSKANGILGLKNNAPGGFVSDDFQANLPYKVKARWTGTTNQAGPSAGSNQDLEVALNQAGATKSQGAWRSALSIGIEAPVADKALVAGNYEDTLTLKLSAI